MKALLHKWKIGKLEKGVRKDIWEEDYELIENEGLFQEYLEMGQFSNCLYMYLLTIYFKFVIYFLYYLFLIAGGRDLFTKMGCSRRRH